MAEPLLLTELTSNLTDVFRRLTDAQSGAQPPSWLLFVIRHEGDTEVVLLPIGPQARLLYALPYRQYFIIDRDDLEFLRSVESAAPHLTRLQRLAQHYADGIMHGVRQGLESPDSF